MQGELQVDVRRDELTENQTLARVNTVMIRFSTGCGGVGWGSLLYYGS